MSTKPVTAALTLWAMRGGRVARRLYRAWMIFAVGGAERELALRWLPRRYRLMVAGPGEEPDEWLHYVSGHDIPIFTRRAGQARAERFLCTHPDDSAWLERTS